MSEKHEIPWSRGSAEDPYTEEDVQAVLDDDTEVVIPSP